MKTIHNARFTPITPGLIRMEYSPSGTFEDRRSVRATHRPEGISFVEVNESGPTTRLSTGKIIIDYRGGPFTAESLCARDAASDQVFWTPDTVDHENLGGVHVAMDCVKPGMIPNGVHPATIKHHPIGIDQSLWTFHGRLHSEPSLTVGDAASHASLFDEVLATRPFESLPVALRELMEERWKYPPGILSRSGFYLYNDTPSPRLDPSTGWPIASQPEEGYLDLYLFYYGKDYKQALADYRVVFGETPLIPRYALGLWYSRYPTFNQQESVELVETFEKHDLPLDMLVFDLEWHKRGWNGFDWDTDHFPDPDQLLDFLKKRSIHTTFNVHPNSVPIDDSRFDTFIEEAGLTCDKSTVKPDYRGVKTFSGFDLANPRHAKAFMDVLHKPVQDQGVDFWWIDGDAKADSVPGLDKQLWTNHVYYDHIRKTYPERRPMIFSREPGIGSHRYPFHFTGDSWSYFETLENQVEQTLRAGHIGQSYITHDIGGHISSALHIDPELYVRWVQFAVLSPVVRLHSSKQGEGVGGERRPWAYGDRVLHSFQVAMRFRMELLPYLYSIAKESNRTGLPMCRSNLIEAPDWEAGYHQWTAYFLGDRIYGAPVVNAGTIRHVILPPGKWYHGIYGSLIESEGQTERVEISPFNQVPLHYIKAGCLLIKQPYCHRASGLPKKLILEIYPAGQPATDTFILDEDDGESQAFQHGAETRQVFHLEENKEAYSVTINAVEGGFPGAPIERSYTLKLVGNQSHAKTLETGPLPLNKTHVLTLNK